MDSTSWVQIVAPVVLSTIISLIITAINNKITKKKMARKLLLGRRISKLLELVTEIKSTIINMKCQVNDFSDDLKDFYMRSGDLQIYMMDNEAAMVSEVGKNKTLYHIDMIEHITESVRKCGILMNTDDSEGFAHSMNKVQDLCEELIKKYNVSLSNIEYM